MEQSVEHLLVIGAILLLLSILASIASSRSGIPSLLLFLAIGILAGSEGLGGIEFNDPWMAQFLGVVALIFILFDGGLNTQWASVRPVLREGIGLSTLGVLITALLVGGFASLLLDLSFAEGVLLGAIVSSTDAAAVFSILRSRNISLKGRLQALLELESGSNDPMAVFLALGMIALLMQPEMSLIDFIPMFIQQMAVGGLMGYGLGRAMVLVINRINLEYEGLYPVLTLALVVMVYGLTALFGGNGFLAVYIAAIVMGNSDFIHKKSLLRFQEGQAWLMQIVMFLTLGLLVYPSSVVEVIPSGLMVAAFLIFLARPISVFITLSFTRLNIREKLMLSWVGLRGAVPIILATFPLLAGLPQADLFFNIVFFIVITSVLIQGTTVTLVSRWLGVDEQMIRRAPSPLEYVPYGKSSSDLVEVPVPKKSGFVGRQIVNLGLPKHVLVVLINRRDEFIVPRGNTTIEAGDILLVLAEKETIEEVAEMVNAPPLPPPAEVP